jgi:hypothetical protein
MRCFRGTDSLESRFLSLIHLFDTLVLVDPETLPRRLTDTGFKNVKVTSILTPFGSARGNRNNRA